MARIGVGGDWVKCGECGASGWNWRETAFGWSLYLCAVCASFLAIKLTPPFTRVAWGAGTGVLDGVAVNGDQVGKLG